jgi:hypothetical protein
MSHFHEILNDGCSCRFCGSWFKNGTTFIRHFRTQHDELNRFETIDGGYQCHYCPKCFATRTVARKHVEDHHHPVDIVYNGNLEEIDTYFIRRNLHWQCRNCGTIVPNATKAEIHLNNWECRDCGAIVPNATEAEIHLKNNFALWNAVPGGYGTDSLLSSQTEPTVRSASFVDQCLNADRRKRILPLPICHDAAHSGTHSLAFPSIPFRVDMPEPSKHQHTGQE